MNKLLSLLHTTRSELKATRKNNRKRLSSYWVAAIYLTDLAYGGPEEGGWYYTSSELQLSAHYPLPVYWKATQKPTEALRAMNEWCTQENIGRPELSSALSIGRYGVKIFRNSLPTHYPRMRPYYS